MRHIFLGEFLNIVFSTSLITFRKNFCSRNSGTARLFRHFSLRCRYAELSIWRHSRFPRLENSNYVVFRNANYRSVTYASNCQCRIAKILSLIDRPWPVRLITAHWWVGIKSIVLLIHAEIAPSQMVKERERERDSQKKGAECRMDAIIVYVER